MNSLFNHLTGRPNTTASNTTLGSPGFLPLSMASQLGIGPIEGLGLPAGLGSIFSILGSFSSFGDWLRLFLIGGLLETGRRSLWSLWYYLLQYLYLEAIIESHEPAYQWILIWLAEQQAWGSARSVLVTSTQKKKMDDRRGRNMGTPLPVYFQSESKHYEEEIQLQPGYGKSCYLWYGHTCIQVTHNRGGENSIAAIFSGGIETSIRSIGVRVYGGSHGKLQRLLHDARNLYKKTAQNKIRIWSSNDSRGMGFAGFSTSITRPKRSLDSVVLDEEVKQMLLDDTQEFLGSENWYAERGIPWRRGYLLHGCPGSGKTSLIHALAGELDLDIYVISLSKRNMDDGDLQQLISMLPSRAIALMEDIDVAFTRASAALQEPDSKLTPPATPYARMRGIGGMDIGSSSSGITLAGLLAAIDGVAAQEGRILFATTNRYSALDPALRRPGRLDVHVEFRPANREQIRKLFTRFYPADPHANVTAPTSTTLVSSDIERPEASTVVETKEATLVEISDEKEMKEEPTSLIVTKVEGKDKAPSLVAEQLAALAKEFASLVPDGELSMASIQGHLMRYKTRPHEAVKQTLKWVEQERKQKRDAQTISMMDHLGVAIASPIAASAN